jgi:hypothetical protein
MVRKDISEPDDALWIDTEGMRKKVSPGSIFLVMPQLQEKLVLAF